MSSQDFTQPTQQMLDPRRLGRDNSGLDESDSADIFLLLTPGSTAATRIVEQAAATRSYHVLFHDIAYASNIEEQATIILDHNIQQSSLHLGQKPADIALRFSSIRHLANKNSGFIFGRNRDMVDIVFGQDSGKRISNRHFRIYFNLEGLIMIEDMSTNGTRVDNTPLRRLDPNARKSRVLTANTEILIPNSANEDETIRFYVRIPQRTEAQLQQYELNKRDFMSEVFTGPDRERALRLQEQTISVEKRWDGGHEYTFMGELGKGAFATVHKIATKMNGHVYAAKELNKKNFIKNGQLDKKIENEMTIMKNLKHPNVIRFIDFRDQGDFFYIIMDYAPYGDLRKHMEKGPLEETAFIRPVAQQVLSALAHLHSLKVTHRDIKPDNILISEMEPLQVKLSDFGLSKVVQHDETFLKTFCGTLLYCAPEVFPYYEQSRKRRRGKDRAYNSACDIYSLGGVLCHAVCGAPPFEGQTDHTGQAMFKYIMRNDLDLSHLKAWNVSGDCIDLLTWMLQRDPSERPSVPECLRHPWLVEGAAIPHDPTLESIVEENEAELEAEHQFSQLSVREEYLDEEDPLSDEEFGQILNDVRASKRVRHDLFYPRNQMRDREDDSSDAPSPESDTAGLVGEESFQPMPRPHRLFGEIGQSALESSGVINVRAKQGRSNAGSAEANVQNTPKARGNARRQSTPTDVPTLGRDIPSASLFGAESGVREFHMSSPPSTGSGPQSPNEPATPRTPEVAQRSSLGYSQKEASQNSEPTPRARPSRLICLPKTPSFYYDPADPSTHNIEYAQRVSGYDFGAQLQGSVAGASRLEDTMHQSAHQDNEASITSTDAPQVIIPASPGFKMLPRRVGKLVATTDSFDPSLVLNLDQHDTSWGRAPANTLVHGDISDTRIPKRAFNIFFWSPNPNTDVKKLSQDGEDWTDAEDLQVAIFTSATSGVWINNKHLRQKDENSRAMFGNLYSGDIITVFSSSTPKQWLKFRCEFYYGQGKMARPLGESFKVQYGGKIGE